MARDLAQLADERLRPTGRDRSLAFGGAWLVGHPRECPLGCISY